MVRCRFTSISAVKDRQSLLMMYFLLLKYSVDKQISYLLPKLLLLVHGGQSFLKKLVQNFLLTIMDSLLETRLLLSDFSQECQLPYGEKKSLKRKAMTIFGKWSWKQQRTTGQWLLEQVKWLQITCLQNTPIPFLKECNLQTKMDLRDLNLSKLETHMVLQDTTNVDHGKVIVTNGQTLTKNKLDIPPKTVQCKECSGSLLNFSLKTGTSSPWLTITRISLIPRWHHQLTLQLKVLSQKVKKQLNRRLIMSTILQRTHTTL